MHHELDDLGTRIPSGTESLVTAPVGFQQTDLFVEAPRPVSGPAQYPGTGAAPRDEPLVWYVLVTRARNERKVFEQLDSKGVEAFLPTVTRWSRWRDRRKQIEWPLFPCYCFVRVSSSQWLPVLTCAGVHHVVSFGSHPAPVEDFEIDSIRRLLATTLPFDPCPFVAEGMMVEVTHGPLTGARGRLLHKGQSTRLVLAVEMLGRAVSVQVDAADVRAL